MKNPVKAVCFDLDGTLILNTDSVAYLCTLNNNKEKYDQVEELEHSNQISWVEADHQKIKLINGLLESKVIDCFDENIQLIDGIRETMRELKDRGLKTVLITAGAKHVAEVVAKRFGFDSVYGSIYEVRDGKFTGEILHHVDDSGKLLCLEMFLKEHNLGLTDCMAVGDSFSDIKVFGAVGKSLGINAEDEKSLNAQNYIRTKNLQEIIKYI